MYSKQSTVNGVHYINTRLFINIEIYEPIFSGVASTWCACVLIVYDRSTVLNQHPKPYKILNLVLFCRSESAFFLQWISLLDCSSFAFYIIIIKFIFGNPLTTWCAANRSKVVVVSLSSINWMNGLNRWFCIQNNEFEITRGWTIKKSAVKLFAAIWWIHRVHRNCSSSEIGCLGWSETIVKLGLMHRKDRNTFLTAGISQQPGSRVSDASCLCENHKT